MGTGRLEAFSDGVLAIIITIMVLELHAPESADVHSLMALSPLVVSYLISFLLVGIYWNNHHHMLHMTDRVTGTILWANLHLLFWLSLLPFVTGWMGDNHFAPLPSAVYGVVLFFAALAYWLLQQAIIASQGEDCTALSLARSTSTAEKTSRLPTESMICAVLDLPFGTP